MIRYSTNTAATSQIWTPCPIFMGIYDLLFFHIDNDFAIHCNFFYNMGLSFFKNCLYSVNLNEITLDNVFFVA